LTRSKDEHAGDGTPPAPRICIDGRFGLRWVRLGALMPRKVAVAARSRVLGASMMMRYAALALFALAPAMARAAPCGELMKLTLANSTVISAAVIPAGDFTPTDTPGKPVTVPAFCRVELRATPVLDSQIGMEVWLPDSGSWNGKLLGVGNGGYSSVLDYSAMADGLRAGYAVVATDQGHHGDDLRFVVGHPSRAPPPLAASVAICTCRTSGSISGYSRDWSSTEGSMLRSAAKAAALLSTADRASSICRQGATDA
jgi:hypothetical protein